MARVKTFANLGSLLPADLNAIQDQYELAFSQWRTLHTFTAEIPAGTTAGTYYLPLAGGNVVSGSNPLASATIPVNAADFDASPRVVKARARLVLVTNAVAPGATFELSVHEVTAWSAASGVEPTASGTAALITGGNVASIAAPGTNTLVVATGTEVTLSTGNKQLFARLTTSVATTVAGARVRAFAQLQYRQV